MPLREEEKRPTELFSACCDLVHLPGLRVFFPPCADQSKKVENIRTSKTVPWVHGLESCTLGSELEDRWKALAPILLRYPCTENTFQPPTARAAKLVRKSENIWPQVGSRAVQFFISCIHRIYTYAPGENRVHEPPKMETFVFKKLHSR